jgi:hypothetical protein
MRNDPRNYAGIHGGYLLHYKGRALFLWLDGSGWRFAIDGNIIPVKNTRIATRRRAADLAQQCVDAMGDSPDRAAPGRL